MNSCSPPLCPSFARIFLGLGTPGAPHFGQSCAINYSESAARTSFASRSSKTEPPESAKIGLKTARNSIPSGLSGNQSILELISGTSEDHRKPLGGPGFLEKVAYFRSRPAQLALRLSGLANRSDTRGSERLKTSFRSSEAPVYPPSRDPSKKDGPREQSTCAADPPGRAGGPAHRPRPGCLIQEIAAEEYR